MANGIDAPIVARCMSGGSPIDPELVGPLEDATGLRGVPGALAARIGSCGYVFVRGAIPKGKVEAARLEVLHRLAEVGEVADPISAARWSGTSRRAELVPDLGRWWQSVARGPALQQVTHGTELRELTQQVLGGETVGQDMVYLRAGVRGNATNLHYDYPFFARATEQIVTCWVPLGDVPIEQGPLAIVEGSDGFDDLIADAKAIDVISHPGKQAALDTPMAVFARDRGTRLLTTDFCAGDVLIFSMLTCHATLDNYAADAAIRMSFDIRYQRATEPRDERFYGENPIGVTGRGYGELNGAKPLGESWHQR